MGDKTEYDFDEQIANAARAREAKERAETRDMFAAFAVVRVRNDFSTKGLDFASQAKAAFDIADAMMAEREKRNV